MTMKAPKAQVIEMPLAQLRRTLDRERHLSERPAASLDDCADGILALDFALTFAGFGYESRQLVLSIVGLAGGSNLTVEAFDGELAKHLNCSERTVRRWRSEHLKESKRKKFSLLLISEGEYNAEHKRYDKTAYSLNPAVAAYVATVVSEARASDLYESDRRAAIERAAEEHYADIPDAPPRSRKKKPYRVPAVKVEQAFVNAARNVERGKRALQELGDDSLASLLESKQGEELRATLLKLRADIEEVLQNFLQAADAEDVDGGIGHFVRYPVDEQGEPSGEDLATWERTFRGLAEPRVCSVELSLRPPPEDMTDEDEFRERVAVLAESGVLDEESAREFEDLAHDPVTREAFARRYMREVTA